MKHLIIILLLLFSMPFSKSLLADDKKYNHLVEKIAEVKEKLGMLSGTSIGVIKGNELIFEAYLGYSNIEEKLPVSKDTQFYIASTTKAVFSLSTLLLEHQRVLNEKTSLQELFPGEKFEGFDASLVTVEHLLTHRSGIDHPAFTWSASWTGLHDQQLRNRFISTLTPNLSSGLNEFEYTNLGYNVMSVWYEKHFGRDWRETVSELVLKPLGMSKTSGYISDIEKYSWELAGPYDYKYRAGMEQVYLSKDDKTMYAIGLLSNVRDVSKLVIAELNNGVLRGKQVIPVSVISKSQIKQAEKYAWGWQVGDYEGVKELYHTGGFVGTSALISFVPEERIGIVVLQNESGLRGNVLGGIIKNFFYQTLIGKTEKQVEDKVKGDRDWLVQKYPAALRKVEDEYLKNLKRSEKSFSKLDNYKGYYLHELAGSISIEKDSKGSSFMSWGNLKGRLMGAKSKNFARANLRPGKYFNVEFMLNDDKVTGLKIKGFTFEKQ